jgi:hypothetical protein
MVAPQSPIGQLDACKPRDKLEVRSAVEGERFTCFAVTPVVSAFVDAWSRRTHAQGDAVIAARRLPAQ